MRVIYKPGDPVEPPPSHRRALRRAFWRRQFDPHPTKRQISFDVAVGILLPIACLLWDPIIFRHALNPGRGLLEPFRLLATLTIGLGVLLLSIWLLRRPAPALFVGLLVGGAMFASFLGVVLIPISLIGLFFGIGALGLSPFATAFVFGRNTVRAWAQARQNHTRFGALCLSTVGLLAVGAAPWSADWYVTKQQSRAMTLALDADETVAARGRADLQYLRLFINTDRLIRDYKHEPNTARRARLAVLYQDLTGGDVVAEAAKSWD